LVEVDAAVLTERERAVLRLLAQGRRTRDIAHDFGISAKTVETYRSRVMLKLGIDNLAGLVRFAIRAGIAPGE
jgi:DNA-binding NarL/FixJ family response regulator